MTIRVRALSDGEAEQLAHMTRSRTLGAGLVRRAQIVQHAVGGLSAPEIAAKMDLCGIMEQAHLTGMRGSRSFSRLWLSPVPERR